MDYDDTAPLIAAPPETIATTAQAIAIRDDIVAEILNLRTDLSNQIIILRGDLVGQVEAIRRAPMDEHEDQNTQIRRLRQEINDKMKKTPTAQQIVLAIVAGYAALGVIGLVALFCLR